MFTTARARTDLQTLLETVLGSDEVHFQPPTNIIMTYPAIVYKRDDARTQFADNIPFHVKKRYQVTVIDRDPDSVIPDKVAALESATFDRHFTANDLNHDVYTLFF